MSKHFLLLAFLIFLLKQDFVESDCCHASCSVLGVMAPTLMKCKDCTIPTPYCGYGPCNIFGCNCDGGCRTGNCGCKLRRRDVEPAPEISDATRAAQAEQAKINSVKKLDEIFEMFDEDKDGLFSFSETINFRFTRHNVTKDDEKTKQEFSKMDTNNDGKLSRDEIDK